MNRSLRRVTALVMGVGLIAGLVGLGMGAASAHSVLISTDPADGSTIDAVPDAVTMTFNEPAIALGTQVLVTGPDGQNLSDGEPELVDTAVIQPLVADRPAGEYVVEWRVTSADGHPIEGRFTFVATVGVGASDDVATPGTEEPDVTSDTGADAGADARAGAGADDRAGADASAGADVGADESTASSVSVPAWVLIGSVLIVIAIGVTGAVVLRARRARPGA